MTQALPTAPPAPPPVGRGRRASLVCLALALLVSGLGLAVSGFRGRSPATAAAGEIFLTPADSPGPNTFTPSVAAPPPPVTVAEAVTAPQPSSGGLIRAAGGAPGLYGGVRDAPSCATERLVAALSSDVSRARPWAGVFGLGPGDIAAFVGSLTPVVTRVDTRVTDFGLRAGRAVASPAILQAGTAVLVDGGGVPRVRCASGNPLGAPQPVATTPRYRGTPWPRFAPTTVIVVDRAPVLPAIILVDLRTGVPFTRLPGSIVIIDLDQLRPGQVIAVAVPGGPVTITGSRWPPGTALTLTFDNPAVTIARATADGAGNFAVTATVPLGALPGPHQVTITGGGFTVVTTVYVVAGPGPAPRVNVVP